MVLPIYFGLGIVVEEDRLATHPELGSEIERLRDPEFLLEMLELSERLRIKEMHWGQVVFYHWQDRLEEVGNRFLKLLSARLQGPVAGGEQLVPASSWSGLRAWTGTSSSAVSPAATRQCTGALSSKLTGCRDVRRWSTAAGRTIPAPSSPELSGRRRARPVG